MNIEGIVAHVVDVLERLGVPYMLTGSLANMAYMKARATADVDFVVVLDKASIGDIAQELGSVFTLDPQMSLETATMTTRYKMRSVATGFSVEFFLLSDDPHDQERFKRRRLISIYGRNIAIATAEDSVIMKVRWLPLVARLKDRMDAEAIIWRQLDQLDWKYIRHWCAQHGTTEMLEAIRRKAIESRGESTDPSVPN